MSNIYDIDGNAISAGTSGGLPNVVFLGDSICTYPDELTFGEWIYWMPQYVPIKSIKTYGVGGARWCVSASNNIYSQFLSLKSEVDGGRVTPDVIVLDAGINDVAYNTSIGTAESAFNGEDILSVDRSTISTVYSSIRYTCESVIAEYPSAQLILVTPYQSGLMARETGVRNVRDAMIESAKRLSLRVINQTDDLGIYNYNESISPLYLRSDGTHPSEAGKRLLARFISSELVKLVFPEDIIGN